MSDCILGDDDDFTILQQHVIALSARAEPNWRLKTEQFLFKMFFGEPPLSSYVTYSRLETIASKLRRHVKKRASRQLGAEAQRHRPVTSDWDKL